MEKTPEQIAAEAYYRGATAAWDAVRGSNADLLRDAGATYRKCCEAANEIRNIAKTAIIQQENTNAD